jgi:hypothetical protein
LFVPAIYRTSVRYVACSRGEKFLAAGKICFTVGSVHGHCKKKTRRDGISASHPAAPPRDADAVATSCTRATRFDSRRARRRRPR